MPQQRTQATTLPNDATETWDDDFEFQSNRSSRSSKTNKHKSASSTLPPPHSPDEESWDDAYEDENAPEMVQCAGELKPRSKPDTDGELGSWGSGSDWSGDGDAEDLSHETYPGTTSEPPERRSSSSASRSSHLKARFPRLSESSIPTPNATSSAIGTPSSTSVSFFSKMSPVKRWKAREADETPKVTSKEPPSVKKAGWEKKLRRSSHKPPTPGQRTVSNMHLSTIASQRNEPSSLTRVFSGGSPSLATHPPGQCSQKLNQSSIFPASPPASTYTPDLTFSPVSLSSTFPTSPSPLSAIGPASSGKVDTPPTSLHISRSRRNVLPNTAASLSLAPALPLISLSAHNLTLSAPPAEHSISSLTPRRSSLSDLKRPQLKIPDRISRAQRDIKRDMDDVKEFAACVAQLRHLQHAYAILLRDLRAALTDPDPDLSLSLALGPHPSLDSPTLLARARRSSFSPQERRDTLATPFPQSSPSKSPKRKFSLTATPPQMPSRYVTALDRLDAKYSVWWECADLLIELGGRHEDSDADTDQSDEEPSLRLGLAAGMTRGRRPRAATLGSDTSGGTARPGSTSTGPPLASPVKATQRRATTGRAGGKDLTPRQLALLQGMLETDAGVGWDPRMAGIERTRKEAGDDGSVRGKGKGGGGRGIRDLWRGLRKGTNPTEGRSKSGGDIGEPLTRGSNSCDSSTSERGSPVGKPGTSTFKPSGTPSPSKRTVTAADTSILLPRKLPTRRPSLAGIFGLGQRVTRADAHAREAGENVTRDASSPDWDRIEIDHQASGTARGTKRLKSKRSLISSSIPSPSLRLHLRDIPPSPDKPLPPLTSSPRLIISFSDNLIFTPSSARAGDSDTTPLRRLLRSARSPSRLDNTQTAIPADSLSPQRVALTPENIRPLLGHTRDVAVHLNECIGEVRHIIAGLSTV